MQSVPILVTASVVATFATPARASDAVASFDRAEFIVPAGFTSQVGTDHVVLEHVDQKRRVFLQISLWASQPSLGSLDRDFASEWKLVVAKNFEVAPTPTPAKAKTQGGAMTATGSAAVRSNIGPMFAELLVFVIGDHVMSILAVAPSEEAMKALSPTFREFLDGVRFRSAVTPTVAEERKPPVATQTPAHATVTWTGDPVAGIWSGFRSESSVDYDPVNNSTDLNLAKLQLRWRTFLADGSCMEDLPAGGLLSLNLERARADKQTGLFWGTWARHGDTVTCTQSSGRVETYHLKGDALVEDAKTTGNAKYARVKPVDGLTLDGRYSTWQKWDDRQRGKNWQSIPVIDFTADGHFDDRGAFMGNPTDRLTGAGERHPGRGSYEVRGYTLALRYDDGREVHHTLTGPFGKDLARDPSVIFIGKFPLYRR